MMHSHFWGIFQWLPDEVLILVVMDDALAQVWQIYYLSKPQQVLILVLMEDALAPL